MPLDDTEKRKIARAIWSYTGEDQKAFAERAGMKYDRLRGLLNDPKKSPPTTDELLVMALAAEIPSAIVIDGWTAERPRRAAPGRGQRPASTSRVADRRRGAAHARDPRTPRYGSSNGIVGRWRAMSSATWCMTSSPVRGVASPSPSSTFKIGCCIRALLLPAVAASPPFPARMTPSSATFESGVGTLGGSADRLSCSTVGGGSTIPRRYCSEKLRRRPAESFRTFLSVRGEES